MRILITGAFGFLGSRIAKSFANLGHDVLMASRNVLRPYEPQFPHKFIHIDNTDKYSLLDACSEVDIVIHAAGMNAPDCSSSPSASFQANCFSTSLLAEAAIIAGVSKFIYLSTAHVYCSPLVGLITESTLPINYHPYAASHLAGEYAALSLTSSSSTSICVLRLSNCFGYPIHLSVNCWSLFINNLCREAVTSQTLTLKNNGGLHRDFLPISDFLNFLSNFLFSSDSSYSFSSSILNIGYGKSFSLLDVASIIQKCCESTLGFHPLIVCPTTSSHPELIYRSNYLLDPFYLPNSFDDEICKLLSFCSESFT